MAWKDFQCGTIYQIMLRMFTPEGTLRAAMPLLSAVADLGVEYVYLCPVAEADGDVDREFWSHRQVASGANNPRNPYRLRDYFKTDPEYGTDADLKEFVRECHRLGLKVLFDLVYLHCGPTAELLRLGPDMVRRDIDGNALRGTWPFLQNNFANQALREHLWRNMEYFVHEFDVDGYRCDVADGVPISFWNEGRRRIDALKPGLFMLSESQGRAEDFGEAFEAAYSFSFLHGVRELCTGERTAASFRENIDRDHREAGLGRHLRGFHTHDIDTDVPMPRLMNDDANDVGIVLCHLMDGVPFLYNGQEVCDHNRHQMFYTAGRGFGVDWSGALTERGRRRRELIKSMTALRRAEPCLLRGAFAWEDFTADAANAKVVLFRRAGRFLALASLDSRPLTVTLGAAASKVVSSRGVTEKPAAAGRRVLRLAPYAWQVENVAEA